MVTTKRIRDSTGGSVNQWNKKEKRDYLPWGPEEDRVLLDLLVGQVQEGRKQCNVFTRDAWDAVIPTFNELMKSNITRAKVRNRMRTWKKTHRVVSKMIKSGFVWDETRTMVTASEEVWDDYVKVHAEAKTYKYRPVLNYDKLVVVVGKTGGESGDVDEDDGSEENTTSDEIMDDCSMDDILEEVSTENACLVGCSLDEDKQLVDMLVDQMQGDEDKSSVNLANRLQNEVVPCIEYLSFMLEGLESEKSPYFLWSPTEDKLLLNLLAEQVRKEGTKAIDFSDETWDDMTLKFNIMMSSNKTKCNMITRLNIWRRMYDIFSGIIQEEGFFWDDSREMVIAEDAVWDNYIKVHPEGLAFRDKIFPNYSALEAVIGHSETIIAEFRALQSHQGFQSLESCAMISSPNKSPYLLWSPKEDKVLLDLFVEQVSKGMKKDNMFTKEAWKEVVQKFNAMMKTGKTKEHMINRMKTWKKTYNVVSALISEEGFGWDECSKMLVAEDKVWDDCIKVHPEAKSYRGKVISNFDELVIVLGNSDASKSISLKTNVLNTSKLHDIAVEHTTDEHEMIPLNGVKKSRSPYFPWPPSEDKLLLELLVEQVHKGEKRDNSFTRDAWIEIVSKFNQVAKTKKTKEHMVNRKKTWRRTYGLVSTMIEKNGFQWDDSKNMVVADDDVWENYLKDHPEARYLRYRSISNYNQMALVLGNAVPERTSTSQMNSFELAGGVQILSGFQPENMQESSSSAGEELKFENSNDNKSLHSFATHPPSLIHYNAQDSSLAMLGSKEVANVVPTFTKLSNVAPAFINKLPEKKEEKENDGSVDCWFDELTMVPDLDEDLFLEATILLQDREKAKIFTRLDPKLRRKWLNLMLRRPNPHFLNTS